jgi:hypothetical protein
MANPVLTTVKPCPSSDPPHLHSMSLCWQYIRGLLCIFEDLVLTRITMPCELGHEALTDEGFPVCRITLQSDSVVRP